MRTIAIAFILTSAHAAACLGGAEDSIRSENQQLRRSVRATNRTGYKILQIDANDGTVLKEYINSAGLVFGVTWQTSHVPNLRQWLGVHFTDFQRAAKTAGHQHGPLVIRTEHIVVESQGHMRSFHGHAFVPRLMPPTLSEAIFQ